MIMLWHMLWCDVQIICYGITNTCFMIWYDRLGDTYVLWHDTHMTWYDVSYKWHTIRCFDMMYNP